MASHIKNVSFYYRSDNTPAEYWAEKLRKWIKSKHSDVQLNDKKPELLIVMGGDGTVLEAAKAYGSKSNPLILGLNLGHVGFLTSVREPKNFLPALDKFFRNKYSVVERMVLSVSVIRNGKNIFTSEALNEAVIHNLLGMVDVDVQIDGTVIKELRGSGVMVSTATGSTAYNLSAHGPIVEPDIKCIILTELLSHDVPSPSIVFKYSKELHFKIKSFRKRGLVSINGSKDKADVILMTDGDKLFPLEEKDTIVVKNSSHLVRFVEFEKNYFFKSLKEKFSIK